jgi:dipeptide transport system substrate-binding protein
MLVSALVTVCLAGLAAGPVRAAAPTTLTVCSAAPPDGFDPTQFTSATTRDAAGYPIYDQLLSVKRGTAEVAPGMAERWSLSPDGLQITLHLRRNVAFHTTPWFTPTRTVNADDVLFSLHRLMDKKSPWLAATKGGFEFWASNGLAELVKAVDKLDDRTVRITLARPSAPFLELLADDKIATVFSAEYGAQLIKAGKLEDLNTRPVGTGPWLFRSYQKDAVLRLAAFPGHWAGKPAIDHLVFAMTPDGKVRAQRVKAGECLVGSYMRAEALDTFAGTPIRAVGGPVLITSFIPINTKRKFLADRNFREALWLALDKPSYAKSVYAGRAQVAHSFLPSVMWSHDATLKRPFDPGRARALVQASGYDGTPITLSMAIGGSIDGKRAGELMQADWARIGVTVKVEMVEWGQLLQRTARGEFDLSHLNDGNSGDPDSLLTPDLSCAAIAGGGNRSAWCHPAFDALLDQARVSSDRAQREALYKKAQRIVFDEVPVIPTVYPQYFTVLSPKVRGFIASPLADLDFRGVSIAE